MINAKELRIGNLVEYKITDKFDERKEWWEVSEIDADDIHWLSKVDEKDEDFRPMSITKEILLKFGYRIDGDIFFKNNSLLRFIGNEVFYSRGEIDNAEFQEYISSVKYVHELQNLHFALTGRELTVA